MRVLKNRNYMILFSGQLVSTIGNSLYSIALPWYVYVLTGSKLDLTLTGLAVTLPEAASLFSGVFVDRWRKKQVMIWTDIIRAVIVLGMFWAVRLKLSFAVLLPLAFLLQLAGSFFMPASVSMIPLVVSGEDLSGALGLNESGSATARLVGTVSGGGLMAAMGAPQVFLGNAFSFVVSVVSLFFIRVREEVSPAPPSSLSSQWWEGILTIVRSRSLLRIIGAVLIANFGMGSLDIVLPVWVKGSLRGNAFLLSLIWGAMLVGMIIGGVCLGRITKRVGAHSAMRAGLMAVGLCVALSGIWPNPLWCVGLEFIAGFFIAAVNGSLNVLLVNAVAQDRRGRVFGTLNGLAVLAVPLGLVVFGFLMAHVAISAVFWLIGLLGIAGGISFFIPLKDDIKSLGLKANSD